MIELYVWIDDVKGPKATLNFDHSKKICKIINFLFIKNIYLRKNTFMQFACYKHITINAFG